MRHIGLDPSSARPAQAAAKLLADSQLRLKLIFICFTGTSLVEIEIETVWLEAENATLMLPETPP